MDAEDRTRATPNQVGSHYARTLPPAVHSQLDAALRYAADGIPVLPLHTPTEAAACTCGHGDCDRPGKHPRRHRRLMRSGLHSASTDPVFIRRWWSLWPNANIGLRTGVLFDVCDVDGLAGVDSLTRLLPGGAQNLPLVRTGSGGYHLYVGATGLGNRIKLLPGVDWRGANGYIIAPPSLHASGQRYRWIRPLQLPLPTCPAPLRDLLEPPQAVAPTVHQSIRHENHYAAAALRQEAANVATALPGTRNNALYRAARKLGQLAGSALLTAEEIHNTLMPAARRVGLRDTEIVATIASGLRAGLREPRARPPDVEPHHAIGPNRGPAADLEYE